MSQPMPTTINLEEMLSLGASHLEKLVDERGRTYFNVFQTPSSAEAVTDWPDFVDLPARYWEAAAMVEPIIGRQIESRERLREWLFSHFEADGLAYRPDGPISPHKAELFDQSRLIYALVSWVLYDPADQEVRERLTALIEGLRRIGTVEQDYAYIEKIGVYYGGTLIRPILHAGLVLERPDWVDFAGQMARGIFNHSDLVGPDGSFKDHVHGALSTIAGAIAYALVTDDRALLARAESGVRYAISISTDFGFVPEVAQRDDDMIACETCTLMDYLDVALLLARHISPTYWDIVEKATRNHLWESQIRDATWLNEDPNAVDEEDVIRRDLRDKIVGAFAGWSAPHCQLACDEHHWAPWVHTEERKPLYLEKIRAVQNCCAGGGIRAVYQVWSNIVTRENDTVSVNLSLDRETEDVRVTSYIPHEGQVNILAKTDCDLRWRVPAGVRVEDIALKGGQEQELRQGFLHFGSVKAGETIEIRFPLAERTDSVVIGNAGRQQYRFDVAWRGDTVMRITPDANNASTGYTRVMKRATPVSFASEGTGPIYQRDGLLAAAVTPSQVSQAPVLIDWYTLPVKA